MNGPAKIIRVFDLLNMLARQQVTLEQICQTMGVCERTVCRYFHLLHRIGFRVVARYGENTGETYYRLDESVRPEFIKALEPSTASGGAD